MLVKAADAQRISVAGLTYQQVVRIGDGMVIHVAAEGWHSITVMALNDRPDDT